jgi:hypothetical protein
MPPKHLTGGKCLGNKADGNGRNNVIFPGTVIPVTLVMPDLREMSPRWPPLRGAVGGCPPDCTYGISMLRILLMIAAVIVIVFVAAEVIHTLFWLALIALVIGFIGMSLGAFRRGRRSERHARRHY